MLLTNSIASGFFNLIIFLYKQNITQWDLTMFLKLTKNWHSYAYNRKRLSEVYAVHKFSLTLNDKLITTKNILRHKPLNK